MNAPPDGYTLLLVGASSAINMTLYEKLNFNFLRDITPIVGVISIPFIMAVRPAKYTDAQREQIGTAAKYDAFLEVTGLGALGLAYRGVKGMTRLANDLNILGVAQDILDKTLGDQIYSKDRKNDQKSQIQTSSRSQNGGQQNMSMTSKASNSQTSSQRSSQGPAYNSFISNLNSFVSAFSAYVVGISSNKAVQPR